MAISNKLETDIKQYMSLSEDELLTQLGARLESVDLEFNQKDSFTAAVPLPPERDRALIMGPKSDALKRLGMRFLKRFNRSLYQVICDASDDDNKQIRDAVGHGADAVAIALGAFLTLHFAWLPGIVVIIASLVAKKFVKDGYEEGCQIWKEQIGDEA
jgi:hypothetical protein